MGIASLCHEEHQRQSTQHKKVTEQVLYKLANFNLKLNMGPAFKPYFPCRYLGKGLYGTTLQVFAKQKKQERFAQKIIKSQWICEQFLFLNPTLFRQLNASTYFVHTKLFKVQGLKVYILMQKLQSGDLYSYMKRNPREIGQELIKQLVINLVLILEVVHSRSLIYRSLRPQNILFKNREGEFQLSQLMFCIPAPQLAGAFYGAAVYAPPEVYQENSQGYGQAIDIWMLGVLIYQVLVGQTPFEFNNLAQIKESVLQFKKEQLSFPEDKDISYHLRDLILRLLQPLPQMRITLSQIKGHPFFVGENWDLDRQNQPEMSIKAIAEKQDYECPNRILYCSLSESRPFTLDFYDLVLQEKSNVESGVY